MNKHIVFTKLYYLLIVPLLLHSCKSPLSDIEIDDPTLLSVNVNIDQDYDNNKTLKVAVKDKNGQAIELKNGFVVLNNKRLAYTNKRYVYHQLKFDDKDFQLTIQYNSNKSWTGKYGEKEGFPGFKTDEPVSNQYERHYQNKFTSKYTLTNVPFNKGQIVFCYDILRDKTQWIENK
ncbi:hypothetical protein [Microscilla marina]|uniref:Uncharacterized protein n=1 Tax=Microscilla marina ATCC 23134 TaxID=313606 RepID=A1ZZ40_MICM2|nr:hypothetical protein [Microscilla marina]EAY24362.1 hypothetical protein M23134_02728 [Microscilla marina ATCC 23134]